MWNLPIEKSVFFLLKDKVCRGILIHLILDYNLVGGKGVLPENLQIALSGILKPKHSQT